MSKQCGHKGEIETKNASLDTLAVTILALHVSGKQMTQAVFKQLPEGIENQASELWGTVRYSIKDSGDLWLVFSSEGKLFRRAINLSRPFAHRGCVREKERNLINAETTFKYGRQRPSDIELVEKARMELAAEIRAYDEALRASELRLEREKKLAALCQLFIAV